MGKNQRFLVVVLSTKSTIQNSSEQSHSYGIPDQLINLGESSSELVYISIAKMQLF